MALSKIHTKTHISHGKFSIIYLVKGEIQNMFEIISFVGETDIFVHIENASKDTKLLKVGTTSEAFCFLLNTILH